MGQATDVAQRIVSSPLSARELTERTSAERTREDVEATLEGEVVERPAPAVAPRPAFQASPATWD